MNWNEKSAGLNRLIPAGRLHYTVRTLIEDEITGEPWAVACSGGADSVCLALLLYGHFPEQRDKLHLLHFNHKLRGEDSDTDEAFVAELAVRLGISFSSRSWKRGIDVKVTEETAREARFNAIEEMMQECVCRNLFVGQHGDDAAETLLMRIARGSGVEGLAAPKPISNIANKYYRIRPLLALRKSEILDALKQCGIPWREDASNTTGTFTRNRIRNEVMPVLNEILPDFVNGVHYINETHQEIVKEFREVFGHLNSTPDTIDLSGFTKDTLASARYCLDRWLTLNGYRSYVNRTAFEILHDKLIDQELHKLSIGLKGFLIAEKGKLSVEHPLEIPVWQKTELRIGEGVVMSWGTQLYAEIIELTDAIRETVSSGHIDTREEAWLDAGKITNGLSASPWQDGDSYVPLGNPGTVKLQDAFINRKIPLEERKILPVVRHGDDILWCPGLLPAHTYRIVDTTKKALRLTYRPVMAV